MLTISKILQPHLIALLLLSGVVMKETKYYFDAMKKIDKQRKVPKVTKAIRKKSKSRYIAPPFLKCLIT